jgi:hypothetical protein
MTDASGFSHICCAKNQYNGGGVCCNDGTDFCMGSCCPGNCELNSNFPNGPLAICQPTKAGCLAAGGTGQLCQTNANCVGVSVSCESGCCHNIPIIP